MIITYKFTSMLFRLLFFMIKNQNDNHYYVLLTLTQNALISGGIK